MRRMGITIASVFLLFSVPLLSVSATAQEARSEISLQGTGLFTKDTTGRDTTQRGTENGGFLVGYRYPRRGRRVRLQSQYTTIFCTRRFVQDSSRHPSGDRRPGSYAAIACKVQDQSLCLGRGRSADF